MAMILNGLRSRRQMIKAFKDICAQLNGHKVEYLVIGGVAVIAHGYPRSTGDVDFWYRPTTENYFNYSLKLNIIRKVRNAVFK